MNPALKEYKVVEETNIRQVKLECAVTEIHKSLWAKKKKVNDPEQQQKGTCVLSKWGRRG